MVIGVKHLKRGARFIAPYELCACAIIAIATVLRIVLTAQNWPQTNSDEDTMGIMALHIAFHGAHPTFLYGQNYMGSIEAYLGALMFHLFGVSVFSLRLGTILLFALFLTSMYCLTSLLYTKKLALITLFLLSLGSGVMLFPELMAHGGYPELLLFGSLSLLLASWLALSYDAHPSVRGRVGRFILYTCWGLVAGLGFWSDFLMLPFIFMSGLLLLLFCRRELLQGGAFFLLLGFVIGISPLIGYNLHAPAGQGLWATLRSLHGDFSAELAQNHAFYHLPLLPELVGTMLVSLPSATGAPPLCFDSGWIDFGHPGIQAFQCPTLHDNLGLAAIAICWSLGFIALWTTAVLLAIRALLQLRQHPPGHSWSVPERRAVIRHFARLAVLGSAGLTLLLFVLSPVSAVFPANFRYLIGLLITIPALIAPLWNVSANEKGTRRGHLGRGILILVGIVFLLGTINIFFELPTVQAFNRQQDALVRDLLRIKATHIYSEYWTCNRVIFESDEQIICVVLYDQLQPGYNRYPPYYAIVKDDPHAAYVFLLRSQQVVSLARQVAISGKIYKIYVFDGYVVYQPART